MVAPGEYFENITAKSGITLQSSAGPLQTIINGNNENVVIDGHTSPAYGFTLDGFTITGGNGYNFQHGASAMYLQSNTTLRNLIIKENTGWSAVVQVSPEDLVLENVAIINNSEGYSSSGSDAALYVYGSGGMAKLVTLF